MNTALNSSSPISTDASQRILLPHGVNTLIMRKGLILACQRKTSNLWCYPGGKIDAGESPMTAAVRETYEETGLRLNPKEMRLFYEGVCLNKDPADTPYWVYSFRCEISDEEEPIAMPGEPPFQWMTPEDFLIHSAFPEYNASSLTAAGIV